MWWRARRLDDDGAATTGGARLDVAGAHAGERDHLVDAPTLAQQSTHLRTGCFGAPGKGGSRQDGENREQDANASSNRTVTVVGSRHVHSSQRERV
jgi:hypothetical protein